MGPTRPQERAFGVFRWHSDSGFQVGEHGLFGAKFESLDGAVDLHVDSAGLAILCRGSGRWRGFRNIQLKIRAKQSCLS